MTGMMQIQNRDWKVHIQQVSALCDDFVSHMKHDITEAPNQSPDGAGSLNITLSF